MGKGVESVDRREGVGRGGGSITTLKYGVAIEAWWQRGAHSNRSPTPITQCAKPNLEPHMEAHRTIYRFKRATVVAATDYKTGDTKIRTDIIEQICTVQSCEIHRTLARGLRHLAILGRRSSSANINKPKVRVRNVTVPHPQARHPPKRDTVYP